LLCLKVTKTTTYRDLVDDLSEMPRIRDTLGLDSIPALSTLCKSFGRLKMAVYRVVSNVSLANLPVNAVTGIDASGFERAHTSAHDTKRTNLTSQQLNTTLLVEIATTAVLNIHVTATRKHETQIAPQVVRRNAASIAVLTGDRGYDDQKLRLLARDREIRPLRTHREFPSLHEVRNARPDSDIYHRRNVNETVKQKSGACVQSGLWWKQFRELVLKYVGHNLERDLAISQEGSECPPSRGGW